MLIEHKNIIKHIIDDNPISINMYWGYRGDYILKLVFTQVQTVIKLEKYCEMFNIEYIMKYDIGVMQHTVFCIVPDSSVYKLKE